MSEENVRPVTPFRKAEIVSHLPADQAGPDQETEQKVTITAGKGVSVSRYSYDEQNQKMKLIWNEQISDDKEITANILDAIAQEFTQSKPEEDIHIKEWNLSITDDTDHQFEWEGSFHTPYDENLSTYIRDCLDDDSLFLFDGNPDRIERIEITYQRNTKIALPEGWEHPDITWNYHEQLILDRASETIEYTRWIADETDITTKYHVAGGVSDLLDDFDVTLFDRVEGNPPDVYENPKDTRTYVIAIITKNEGKREISGSFDRKGLPMGFSDFMGDLSSFLDFYGTGEVFDEQLYDHVRRRIGELIFCRVEFAWNGPSYWYLADTDAYRPMDLVIVPAGEENQETVGRIVTIEYHTKEHAPYPLDSIKKIIRPFDEEKDHCPDNL